MRQDEFNGWVPDWPPQDDEGTGTGEHESAERPSSRAEIVAFLFDLAIIALGFLGVLAFFAVLHVVVVQLIR